jgi:hypothetical protein
LAFFRQKGLHAPVIELNKFSWCNIPCIEFSSRKESNVVEWWLAKVWELKGIRRKWVKEGACSMQAEVTSDLYY